MRRAALLLAAAALATAGATAAGCGDSDDEDRPPAAADPTNARGDPGLRVWVAQGCGSCHTLKAAGATGDFGPDLGETLKGKSKAYVLESIVAPGAATAPGFSTGMMPEDYAEKIPREQLDLLADFLLRAAGRG